MTFANSWDKCNDASELINIFLQVGVCYSKLPTTQLIFSKWSLKSTRFSSNLMCDLGRQHCLSNLDKLFGSHYGFWPPFLCLIEKSFNPNLSSFRHWHVSLIVGFCLIIFMKKMKQNPYFYISLMAHSSTSWNDCLITLHL